MIADELPCAESLGAGHFTRRGRPRHRDGERPIPRPCRSRNGADPRAGTETVGDPWPPTQWPPAPLGEAGHVRGVALDRPARWRHAICGAPMISAWPSELRARLRARSSDQRSASSMPILRSRLIRASAPLVRAAARVEAPGARSAASPKVAKPHVHRICTPVG